MSTTAATIAVKVKTNTVAEYIEKSIILFGLLFAELSNIFFLSFAGFDIPEIFDFFLIISLIFVFSREINKEITIKNKLYNSILSKIHNIENYKNIILLLGIINNYLVLLFITIWGYIDIEKKYDLSFTSVFGVPDNIHKIFEIITIVSLTLLTIKFYKSIENIDIVKVFIYEFYLITILGIFALAMLLIMWES